MTHWSLGRSLYVQRRAMRLRKVCMRMTIPVPGRLGAAFLSSSLTVLLFGVMVSCQGGLLRPMLALLPLPALGGLICLSYFFWVLFWIVLSYIHPRRTRVRRHAPELDGCFPGGNAAEHPPRGGEFCIKIIGALSFSHVQGRTAVPLHIASAPVVAWGTHIASECLRGSRW